MSQDPLVSVLLPCFNAERFLPAALESLLAQSYSALEILALDDGSTDGTAAVLQRYAADERLRVVRSASNRGLIPTLNQGVADVRGELIARMDADDVALPHRIARQVELLRARPEIGVVGSGVELIDEAGAHIGARAVRCREPGGARFTALFATPIAHPTLVARTAVMRAHPYGQGADSLHTEDYELFARMLAAGEQFANVDEPLVRMRISAGSVSQRYEAIQVANFVTCARRHLERTLGLAPPTGPHKVFVNRMDAETTPHDLAAGLRLLDEAESAFLEHEPAATDEIRGIADEQLVDIVGQALLKGTPRLRAAALTQLTRRAPRILSPRGRRHLVAKLRR